MLIFSVLAVVEALNRIRDEKVYDFYEEKYRLDVEGFQEDIACEGIPFEDCCKEIQWPLWYPLNFSEPMDSFYNTVVQAAPVETSIYNGFTRYPGQPGSTSNRWTARYQCDDTRPWEEMLLTEPIQERDHVVRTLMWWIFYCPYLWVMIVGDPVPKSGATDSLRRSVKCLPREEAPPDLRAKVEHLLSRHIIVSSGSIQCIRTIMNSHFSSLQLSANRWYNTPPKQMEIMGQIVEYRDLEPSSYAEVVEVPFMSLGRTAPSPTAELQAAHRQIEFRTSSMEIDAHGGNTYSGCAEAPLEMEIELSMAALSLDGPNAFPALENK